MLFYVERIYGLLKDDINALQPLTCYRPSAPHKGSGLNYSGHMNKVSSKKSRQITEQFFLAVELTDIIESVQLFFIGGARVSWWLKNR